jgi:hypothetical protein
MIQKISHQSRTTEVDDAATLINGAYENAGLGANSFLASVFATLVTLLGQLRDAINRMKAESILDEKDGVRDNILRSLYYMILGYFHNPDATIQSAAAELMTIFDNYGLSITEESYSTESSLVNSLLADFSAPGPLAAIPLLPGCAVQIAALQAAQDDFEATRIVYDQQRGGESTEANATTLKKDVVKVINEQLVIHLRSKILEDEATYGDFVRTVGQIIADNNEVVKRRRNKAEA